MTLGARIEQNRKQLHLSQGDLAEQLNVSRQSVSKWETNSSIPDLPKLVEMSQLFGITLDELVTGNPPPKAEVPYHETPWDTLRRISGGYQNTIIQPIIGGIMMLYGAFYLLLSLILSLYFLPLCICLLSLGFFLIKVKVIPRIFATWIILLVLLIPMWSTLGFTFPDLFGWFFEQILEWSPVSSVIFYVHIFAVSVLLILVVFWVYSALKSPHYQNHKPLAIAHGGVLFFAPHWFLAFSWISSGAFRLFYYSWNGVEIALTLLVTVFALVATKRCKFFSKA